MGWRRWPAGRGRVSERQEKREKASIATTASAVTVLASAKVAW
ncbi:hypothetical protein [Methylacidimicrobium sp. AP8]|nr:hypothetical protein [Methylacidimicrobium sp. AP8]